MNRIFVVKLRSGNSPGPYSIFYDEISETTVCTLYGTANPAINLTLAQLTTADGVKVETPESATTIIVVDQTNYSLCNNLTIDLDCNLEVEILNIEDLTEQPLVCEINVPKSFSPNNDGVNDFFRVTGLECYPNNEMFIFDRDGVFYFTTKSYHTNPWNGKKNNNGSLAPTGFYVWLLYINGELYSTGEFSLYT